MGELVQVQHFGNEALVEVEILQCREVGQSPELHLLVGVLQTGIVYKRAERGSPQGRRFVFVFHPKKQRVARGKDVAATLFQSLRMIALDDVYGLGLGLRIDEFGQGSVSLFKTEELRIVGDSFFNIFLILGCIFV